MNKIIEAQLAKVKKADLSNFNKETNTYFIPKKNEINLKIGKNYLIHLKYDFFLNSSFNKVWNNNSQPSFYYCIAEIDTIENDKIHTNCIEMDIKNKTTKSNFWKGWFKLNDIEILQEIK